MPRVSLRRAYVCACVFLCVAGSTYEMVQPSVKSPLFSFKGLTWIFNDEPRIFYMPSILNDSILFNAYLTDRIGTALLRRLMG